MPETNQPQPPHQVFDGLRRVLDQEHGRDLTALLETSLRRAGERAEAALHPDLYQALDWPTDLEGYGDYLRGFLRWIPRQTDNPAWKSSAPEERYAKEVSDRLAHFYFLVDQDVDDGQSLARTCEPFRDWLTGFARQWGSFLDTTESFGPEILESFLEEAPEYHVEESMIAGRPNQPSGWLTFNQFFARQLNPGLRPISAPGDNRVVTSPADCSYKRTYDIGADSSIPATRLKHTHEYGDIRQLLEGSRYADAFAGGTFVHYMLPPSAYHRYHLPVAGRVEEAFVNQGKVYMQVDLEGDQLVSKDNTQSGYEFSQTRGVVTVDTAASGLGDLGVVAVVPVGMSHVSSVNLSVVEGSQASKGQEFGYFLFGGSDIILLFQEGVDPQVDTEGGARRVGTPVAHCRLR